MDTVNAVMKTLSVSVVEQTMSSVKLCESLNVRNSELTRCNGSCLMKVDESRKMILTPKQLSILEIDSRDWHSE